QDLVQVELADLTGVDILYDAYHGGPPSTYWSIILFDCITRGATVTELNVPVATALLADYELYWLPANTTNWSASELAALADWVDNGGSMLFEAYDSGSMGPYNQLLDDLNSGINYDFGTYLNGTMTDITEHPTTADVSAVTIPWGQTRLVLFGPTAFPLVRDGAGAVNIAGSQSGLGRIMACSDVLFYDNFINSDDNRLFANQIVDWLAGGGVDWLFAEPLTGTVPAGGSSDVTVTFDASDLCGGHLYSNLLFESNDPDDPVVTVPAHMHVTGEPNIALSDSALVFGEQHVGTGSDLNLEIGNPGCDVLEVTNIAVTGDGFSADTTPFSLAIGESRLLVVTFTVPHVGHFEGSLELTSNDPDQPLVTVPLTGDGVTPPQISVAPDSLQATTWETSTVSTSMTIHNLGQQPLEWTISAQEESGDAVAKSAASPGRRTDGGALPGKSDKAGNPGSRKPKGSGLETAIGPSAEAAPPAVGVTLGEAVILITDVNWIYVNFPTGSTAPGDSAVVTVTLGSSILPTGIHSAILFIDSNDPSTPQVAVPVTLQVFGAQFIVEIEVDYQSQTDRNNMLGAMDDGSDQYDPAYDLPEPAPTTPVYGFFPHPEWITPVGNNFQSDMRAGYDPAHVLKSWIFEVKKDVTGDLPIRLNFDPSFEEASGWGFYLTDVATGQTYNLFGSLSYLYNQNPVGSRLFEITVGLDLPLPDPPERPLPQGWAMVGFPRIPPVGANTLADVILDDAPGTTFLFRYDPDAGFEQCAGDDPLVQGEGLWVAATEAFTWDMEGIFDHDGVPVPLNNGWTLVGYPLWMPGDLDGITVSQGDSTYSYTQAVSRGLVAPGAYDYDDASGNYVLTTDQAAYRGYWFAAYVDDVTLFYDYRNMDDGSPVILATSASKELPANWQIQIGLAEGDDVIEIGQHPDASNGFDAAFDLPVPPLAPGSSQETSLRLARPEWDLSTGDYFRSDIMAVGDDIEPWSCQIIRDEPGPVTLHWNVADWPADLDLRVYLPSQNRVVLMSMREQPSLTVSVGAEPLVVQFCTPDFLTGLPDAELVGLNLRNVPNPFNPNTSFHFNLPRDSQTELRIYNIRGSLVCRLDGGFMTTGPATLVWRGRDNNNERVASGAYFYRLYLDGRQEGPARKMIMVK
ncbi:MAG: choice-of-anchor D domain-containing protein, partial [bacterium]